jgi:phage anti-repressor protein
MADDIKTNVGKINDSVFLEKLKSSIDYKCDWAQADIDNTLKFLIQSFRMDQNDEKFPIKLDDLSKVLGYNYIKDIRKTLLSIFKENVDYKIDKAEYKNGGQNKINIFLTVKCTKKLCMMSKAKKADSFRIYYIAVEDFFKECILDSSNQLIGSIREIVTQSCPLIERRSVENKVQIEIGDAPCFYFIEIGDEKYGASFKPGITACLSSRTLQHRKTFGTNISVIAAINISHLNLSESNIYDKNVKSYLKSLNILNKIHNSTETITLLNREDIHPIIEHVRYMLITLFPKNTLCTDTNINYKMEIYRLENDIKVNNTSNEHQFNMAKLDFEHKRYILNSEAEQRKLDSEAEQRKLDHEYRMALLNIQQSPVVIPIIEVSAPITPVHEILTIPSPQVLQRWQKWIIDNPPGIEEHKRKYYNRMKIENPAFKEKVTTHNTFMDTKGWCNGRVNTGHYIWIKKPVTI